MFARRRWVGVVGLLLGMVLAGGCRLDPEPPEVDPLRSVHNLTPVLDTVEVSAERVRLSGTLSLHARAQDGNVRDLLRYSWTAPAGVFSAATRAQTQWTAPPTPGPVGLTVTVTDTLGASVSQTLTVAVLPPNQTPRLEGLTVSPARLEWGSPARLGVVASDGDDDALTYVWEATGCTGTWAEASSATPRFTPHSLPPGGACDCHLGVTVSDPWGGVARGATSLCVSAFSLPSDGWAAVGGVSGARPGMRATLLRSGEVLLSGGWFESTGWPAEVFDPRTGVSRPTGPMMQLARRSDHTATLLPSGKVLVTGGGSATAEFYIPETNSWHMTGAMSMGRQGHTATLLPSGKVLVMGGGTDPRSAELYEPDTGRWRRVAPSLLLHTRHTATLLPSGQVLVVGGTNNTGAELFDPETEAWTVVSPPATARSGHVAVLLPSGEVLVAGGVQEDKGLREAEVYDPARDVWRPAGTLNQLGGNENAAVALPSGKVLLVNGSTLAELYDPARGTWTSLPLGEARGRELVRLSSGEVLLFPEADRGRTAVARFDPVTETWRDSGAPNNDRLRSSATLLSTGKVLVAGQDSTGGTVRLFDPATLTWAPTGAMTHARQGHTATLLASGKVLVVGGTGLHNQNTVTAELYDPARGTWSLVPPPSTLRVFHTATLLASGKVLVVGGYQGDGGLGTRADLYDPARGTWSPTGSMATGRARHTATLLPSGQVLVVGGTPSTTENATAELYDPARGTWSSAGTLTLPRGEHTATWVPSAGGVLVVGGARFNRMGELYDPRTSRWSRRGELLAPRSGHSATLMPSGQVLLVGGTADAPDVELYEPVTGVSRGRAGRIVRSGHQALVVPSGQVLVVGGDNQGSALGLLYTP